jgi:acyl-CoA hydrolase/GNAT superfamily N-acetyltransferase
MPQDWRERYADKIVTADFAAKQIHPGDRVFIGSASGEPQALVRAMVQAGEKLADTEIVQVLTLGVAPYADPKYAPVFRPNAFFIGAGVRGAVNEARADYTPIFLSQVPRLLKSKSLPIDVALIMVTPPDEHGVCSLGVSVDITKAAASCAKLVVAQVNKNMPYALGDCFIHVNQIHHLIECDEPLLEFPGHGDGGDITQQIGAQVTRLIPDGATLQLGIGRVPDAILAWLSNKNDLGIHSEMISDGVMKLARAGIITGKHKNLHKGKIVGSFAAGSRELYSWMHENPQIEMYPSDYTNDLFTISQHDNMVAINSALEVDLTGQVTADSLGTQFYSGIGGHADFIRGAALAKGGRPIIVLPSTANTAEGVKSRIVANFNEGAGVVTTRGDTYYVVTEYGIAYLHGKSMRERAMSLISIAHPDFRGELLHAAKRRKIVYPNQLMPPTRFAYPAKYESPSTLRDGSHILIRPIRSEDEPQMKEMFYSFSEQTVYLRFHATLKSMPHNKLQLFCNVDYDTEMALVATTGEPGNEDMVATGRYLTDPSKTSAEMAFSVRDDWQRKGLGTLLFQKLIEIGKANGIAKFSADVLIENSGMLKIFHRSGLNIETSTEGGVVHVIMALPDKPAPAKR